MPELLRTLDVTLIATLITLAGALIALVVQQFLESFRHRQRLKEERRLRLRDDRRLLYREVLELTYAIVNTFNRAANWAFIDEVARVEGFDVEDEVQTRAEEEAGVLTSDISAKLDILQARLREIEVLGGENTSLAAHAIHASIAKLWHAFPTALGRPVGRKEYLRLMDDAEDAIRSFVDEIQREIRLVSD